MAQRDGNEHQTDDLETTGLSRGGISKLKVAGIFAAVALPLAAYNSFRIVDAGHFGVRVLFGQVVNDQLPAGFHAKWPLPFLDSIYEMRNNTIIHETIAGTGRNTHEQNIMTAKTRMHYQIDPKAGVMALHVSAMSSDNGQALLDKLMDDSFNAVVGERHSTEHLRDTEGLLKAFVQNLEWRIAQSNIPISMDAVELLELQIGDGANPYRIPVQLRIVRQDSEGKQGWKVEKMAGPAAVPVPRAGETIAPTPK